MSLMTSLLTARTGLQAASQGIDVTSHNVANALTEGFHRRTVDQSAASLLPQSGAWIGAGVTGQGVSRNADIFLQMNRVRQGGLAGASTTLRDNLSVVEPAFDELSGAGPMGSLAEFFDALNRATQDPSYMGARSEVLDAAEGLATALNRTADHLTSSQELFTERLGMAVTGANEMLAEIAQLNLAIETGGDTLSNGDLMDRRDQLLHDAAGLLGTTAHIEPNGTATVFVGGHAVVSGDNYRPVELQTPIGGPPQLLVETDSGDVLVTDLAGGTIGGHIEAHQLTTGYLDELNDFAERFAFAFNADHQNGWDANGVAGGDLFTFDPGDPASSLTIAFDDPNMLAFAGDATAAAGDGDNLAALLDLENAPLFNGSHAAERLGAIGASVGMDITTAEVHASRDTAILQDLTQIDMSMHGVDLDQEAANLITFQTAYQAAAKVIQTTDEMLGTLMEIAR